MPNLRVLQALGGLLLIISALAALSGVESCRGQKAEHVAAVAQGEANANIRQAQAIPDHAAPLAEAQAGVDRARAKVARTHQRVEAKPSIPVLPAPDANQAISSPVADPGGTADLVAAQDVLIVELKAALADEHKRSESYRLAFEAERRRAAGLQIALDAQKHVQSASKWRGRVEGFVVGAALGYVGGR